MDFGDVEEIRAIRHLIASHFDALRWSPGSGTDLTGPR